MAMEQIADDFFVETGFHGSNDSVLRVGRRLVLFDAPQLPRDAQRWREEVEALGRVDYLVNGTTWKNSLLPTPILSSRASAASKVRQMVWPRSARRLVRQRRSTTAICRRSSCRELTRRREDGRWTIS